MTVASCSAHPGVAAGHRCDGCGRMLCEACIEHGHRLLFCKHCGERALPLAAAGAATAQQAVRLAKARAAAAYGPAQALAYPFRGLGGYVFWGYVISLCILAVLALIPGFGLAALILRSVISVSVPGLLFDIVRTTFEGDDQLPDWPDWSYFGERASEVFSMLVVALLSALPGLLVLLLVGCGPGALFSGDWGFECLPALAIGLAVGFVYWVGAFGVTGLFQSFWYSVRVDLHVRAIAAMFPGSVVTGLLVGGLFFSGFVLRVVLGFLPLVGLVASVAVGVYASLLGAHLVGLLLRRHRQALEMLYGRAL